MTETTSRTPPMRTKDGCEMFELLYIQDGRTLYKVSTVYDHRITAQVCLDRGALPNRTRVRILTRSQVAQMTMASRRIVDSYHRKLDGLE